MPRNKSEKVDPLDGMSKELFEYLHAEAIGPQVTLHQGGSRLRDEYLATDYDTRCRFRHALRKAAGLRAHHAGLAKGDPVTVGLPCPFS